MPGQGRDSLRRFRKRSVQEVEIQFSDEKVSFAWQPARFGNIRTQKTDKAEFLTVVPRYGRSPTCNQEGLLGRVEAWSHAKRSTQSLDDALEMEEVHRTGAARPVNGWCRACPRDSDSTSFAPDRESRPDFE